MGLFFYAIGACFLPFVYRDLVSKDRKSFAFFVLFLTLFFPIFPILYCGASYISNKRTLGTGGVKNHCSRCGKVVSRSAVSCPYCLNKLEIP